MNRKKTLLPFVLTCVFAGLSGVAFGVALAIIARATLVSLDPSVMPIALYSLIGGILFGLQMLVFKDNEMLKKAAGGVCWDNCPTEGSCSHHVCGTVGWENFKGC